MSDGEDDAARGDDALAMLGRAARDRNLNSSGEDSEGLAAEEADHTRGQRRRIRGRGGVEPAFWFDVRKAKAQRCGDGGGCGSSNFHVLLTDLRQTSHSHKSKLTTRIASRDVPAHAGAHAAQPMLAR